MLSWLVTLDVADGVGDMAGMTVEGKLVDWFVPLRIVEGGDSGACWGEKGSVLLGRYPGAVSIPGVGKGDGPSAGRDDVDE